MLTEKQVSFQDRKRENAPKFHTTLTLLKSNLSYLELFIKHFITAIKSISKFFVYCCHSDVDFTKNCILTNLKDKITFKGIEKHRCGLPKTVSKHPLKYVLAILFLVVYVRCFWIVLWHLSEFSQAQSGKPSIFTCG